MKILCISNYYPPFSEGGYELSIKGIMDYLHSRGYEVHILAGERGVKDNALINDDKTQSKVIRTLKYIDYSRPSFKNKHDTEVFNYITTSSLLKIYKPDLVYFGNQKAISIAPIIAVQEQGIKRIFDLCDFWPDLYLKADTKSRLFSFLKQILPFTIGGKLKLNPMIACSDWVAEEIKQKYHSPDVYTIPRAVKINPVFTEKNSTKMRFLFAGRIDESKGFGLLIEALGLLKYEGIIVDVDAYGEISPAYHNECFSLIDKFQLKQNIIFKGQKADMTQVLPYYDVLLMPSNCRESFGRIIIEAMANRVIPIASNAFGPKEIITDKVDGYLFEYGSALALAKAMENILKKPLSDIRIIQENAYHTALSKYNAERIHRDVEALLFSIIDQLKA